MKLGMIVDYAGGFDQTVELSRTTSARPPAGRGSRGVLLRRRQPARLHRGAHREVELASAILQVYSRTPALTGDDRRRSRLRLRRPVHPGLGASGPQVVEGFHGVPYDAPLGRTREVIEICRKVWRREPV